MDHLKELLNLGVLIQPEALEKLKTLGKKDIEIIFEKTKEEKILVLSEDFIEKTLGKTSIRILKSFEPIESQTLESLVELLNERYKTLQEILLRKLELTNVVSINKCSSGKVTIIGMIKDLKEKKENLILELEDTTGTLQVLLPKLEKKPSLDDVVAVSGNINNNILFGEKIIYPDLPLRPVNYSEEPVRVGFLKNNNVDFLISNTEVRGKNNNIEKITNPCLIELNSVVILIAFDVDPLGVLKKRYISVKNNDFIVDPIPDIFFTNKEINMNYKGTSILGPNNIINLKTRELNNRS